jgi:hypothetical protein
MATLKKRAATVNVSKQGVAKPSHSETSEPVRPRKPVPERFQKEKSTMSDKIESVITPTAEAFQAGYEKLQASFGEAFVQSKANMDAMTNSAKIAADGVKQASEISLAYIQSSAALATETAKTLGGVKSLQEAVEIQADYARSAMSTYFAEFTKVSDVMLGAMKESVKPISERTSAVWSSIQSAR